MTWSSAELDLGRHEIRISPYLAGEYSLPNPSPSPKTLALAQP